MKLKINITKEILRRSMYCGVAKHNLPENVQHNYETENGVSQNCAIALAVRDVFPNADVGTETLCFDSDSYVDKKIEYYSCNLPVMAINFIQQFDRMKSVDCEDRLDMEEFSFEIKVPEGLINQIGIEDYKNYVREAEVLELVE